MRGLTVRGLMWLDMAMKRVGVAELKNNLSRILRGVEIGEVVEVMDRARPIARIVPVEREQRATIRPAGRRFASIRDRTYPPLAPGIDALDLLHEERAERPLVRESD
jgi:prevent-host-death family protein